jgi:2-hydroxychromene-2-carboxylate isomerase
MSTKGVADVVFCIDASASMQPCIEGVRTHVSDFVTALTAARQGVEWDLRLDFVAHHASEGTNNGAVFAASSVGTDPGGLWNALYGQSPGRLFTKALPEFRDALQKVEVAGNEAPLIALDFALDFPWRDAKTCHRVVIMLTDEAAESGVAVELQSAAITQLQEKIQDLRVMLFLVGPDSQIFNRLAEVNRSEYEVVPGNGDGLARVDFGKVLAYIGKSVSVSNLQATSAPAVKRGLFGQPGWGGGSFSGAGR